MAQDALPSQLFVDIDDIRNDVVILKDGRLRKVLLVSGVNTELKSEDEQNVVYDSFQSFLNGIDFSIELIAHSRKLNIQEYLDFLKERENIESNELLKTGIAEYIEFIKSFVKENDIMTKTFFIVVPFDPVGTAEKKEIKSIFSRLTGKARPAEDAAVQEAELEKSMQQLNQRVDQVVVGLHNIDLRAVALNNEELIEFFYNLYNPKTVERKNINMPQ